MHIYTYARAVNSSLCIASRQRRASAHDNARAQIYALGACVIVKQYGHRKNPILYYNFPHCDPFMPHRKKVRWDLQWSYETSSGVHQDCTYYHWNVRHRETDMLMRRSHASKLPLVARARMYSRIGTVFVIFQMRSAAARGATRDL